MSRQASGSSIWQPVQEWTSCDKVINLWEFMIVSFVWRIVSCLGGVTQVVSRRQVQSKYYSPALLLVLHRCTRVCNHMQSIYPITAAIICLSVLLWFELWAMHSAQNEPRRYICSAAAVMPIIFRESWTALEIMLGSQLGCGKSPECDKKTI